jgi:hypothetical protein
MIKLNEKAIIATQREMIDAGLATTLRENLFPIDCDTIFLWVFFKPVTTRKKKWAMLTELSINRDANSTHVINKYYASFPKAEVCKEKYLFVEALRDKYSLELSEVA